MTRGASRARAMTALWAASTRRACSRRLLPGVIACLSLASTRPTLAADETSDCPRLSEVVAALGQVVAADVAQAAASEIAIRDLGSSWQIEVRAHASSYAEPARNCAERAKVAAVFAALVMLTAATVAVAGVDLGNLNLYIALAIAGTKATLVVLYFMHLRYDRPFHLVLFLGCLGFVVLFISLVLTDTRAYNPSIHPGQAPGMKGVHAPLGTEQP
jgi:caa(3)-type oxidase subunit IV